MMLASGRHQRVSSLAPNNRPFEQRVVRPRTARRMNHPFKYLFRHGFDNCTITNDPIQYLADEGLYTKDQIVEMNRTFPMLLQLSVQRQLFPKMQFLKHTLNVSVPAEILQRLPPHYFGSRLERIIAPRHAFLVWAGLPSGKALFESNSDNSQSLCLFHDFLVASRKTKQFAALCQSWRDKQQLPPANPQPSGRITAKDIEAFDTIFSRGLMAAVRNELVQPNNTWPLEQLPTLVPSDIMRLLVEHGANPLARDHRGATLLHWACGTGHWEAARQLLPYYSVWTTTTRDGATPLHWGVAGATAREFGIGGHVDVCQNLLSHVQESHASVKDYVNLLTKDGNSALMWAAWAGCLATVKLLARNRADTSVSNRNGCSVAHWAASGGNLEVCRYLADTLNVDFTLPNHGGSKYVIIVVRILIKSATDNVSFSCIFQTHPCRMLWHLGAQTSWSGFCVNSLNLIKTRRNC